MNKNNLIEYKTAISAPLEKVWDALTNPKTIKRYFFGTDLVTTWKVGGDIIFQGEWEGQKYKDKGEVLEYEHNKRLAYSYLSNWSGKEDKPENYLWVCFEVKEINNETELTIFQSNYDAEKAEHSKGNWEMLMGEMRKVL